MSKIKCNCPCHRDPNFKHVTACCTGGYVELPDFVKDPSDTPQKILRWVKGSERLPNEQNEEYFLRYRNTEEWIKITAFFDNDAKGFYTIEVDCNMVYLPDISSLEWLEEAEAPAVPPTLLKEKVIALIKLYQSHIPEEKYDWDEHVRDLDNIIFDIENNLQAAETPAPGEDYSGKNAPKEPVPAQQGEMPERVKTWIESEANKKFSGGYRHREGYGYKAGAVAMYRRDQEQIKALQSQISEYETGLEEIKRYAGGPAFDIANGLLKKYKPASK